MTGGRAGAYERPEKEGRRSGARMSGRLPRRFPPQPRAATPSRRESRLHHKKVATLLEGFDDEGFTLARRGNLERWGGAAELG